jgi:hypothetical protein
VIGWLYDLVASRSERKGMAGLRRRVLASLEGDVVEIGAGHVRGAGRVARWQDRLTPLHRKIMGNCHLNRDTLAAVRAAGFDTSGVVRAELPAEPALYRAGILGRATRISS